MASAQGSPPPYPPTTWALGGQVQENPDIPITAVLLAFYVVGAASHMAIFQKNRFRGHKFIMSVLMFGFCMCRIVTCSLRIASATRPRNIRLAIAAQIFVAAGVLLVYVINLLFAQRLIRAQHPRWGWSRPFSLFFKANYVLIVASLAMVITVTVQSFYTLSTNTRRIDRDVQLYVATYFAFVSFLPIPLVVLGLVVPRKTRIEKFGSGRWRTKLAVLLTSSFLVCLGACYRCGTAYLPLVRRATAPLPAYYSKAAFYVFNFVLEILVIYLYLFLRIDRRFHIPNGARGPGSYVVQTKPGATVELLPKRGILLAGKKHDSVQSGLDRPGTGVSSATTTGGGTGVYTEEETFDDLPPPPPLPLLLSQQHGHGHHPALKLRTHDVSSEKRRAGGGRHDVEAQLLPPSEPQSAISGTTAALSKDHLLLPESPALAHIKPSQHDDVPPVPPLPPQTLASAGAAGAAAASSTNTHAHTNAQTTGAQEAQIAKLDRVVDILLGLDARLAALETAPARQTSVLDPLLERLGARLARLEEQELLQQQQQQQQQYARQRASSTYSSEAHSVSPFARPATLSVGAGAGAALGTRSPDLHATTSTSPFARPRTSSSSDADAHLLARLERRLETLETLAQPAPPHLRQRATAAPSANQEALQALLAKLERVEAGVSLSSLPQMMSPVPLSQAVPASSPSQQQQQPQQNEWRSSLFSPGPGDVGLALLDTGTGTGTGTGPGSGTNANVDIDARSSHSSSHSSSSGSGATNTTTIPLGVPLPVPVSLAQLQRQQRERERGFELEHDHGREWESRSERRGSVQTYHPYRQGHSQAQQARAQQAQAQAQAQHGVYEAYMPSRPVQWEGDGEREQDEHEREQYRQYLRYLRPAGEREDERDDERDEAEGEGERGSEERGRRREREGW